MVYWPSSKMHLEDVNRPDVTLCGRKLPTVRYYWTVGRVLCRTCARV